MGLSKPIIITSSAVDTSNLATKSDMTTLQNSVTSALANVGGKKIKSIQGGTVKGNNSNNFSTVTISSVNKNKSIIWASGMYKVNNSTPYTNATYKASNFISDTQINVWFGYAGGDAYAADWIVIEFE